MQAVRAGATELAKYRAKLDMKRNFVDLARLELSNDNTRLAAADA